MLELTTFQLEPFQFYWGSQRLPNPGLWRPCYIQASPLSSLPQITATTPPASLPLSPSVLPFLLSLPIPHPKASTQKRQAHLANTHLPIPWYLYARPYHTLDSVISQTPIIPPVITIPALPHASCLLLEKHRLFLLHVSHQGTHLFKLPGGDWGKYDQHFLYI